MKSKHLEFLLNENEINKISNDVGLCKRIRKFTPMELLKMVTFSPNSIVAEVLKIFLVLLNKFKKKELI